ncbi:hypothetical protein PMIN06_011458 [Paraphaeosphaeria minitans]
MAMFPSTFTTHKAKEIPPRLTCLAAQDGLAPVSVRALVKAGLSGTAATVAKIPGITFKRLPAYTVLIRDGNVKSYHMVFYSSLAFGGIIVVCALCCKEFNSNSTDLVDPKL